MAEEVKRFFEVFLIFYRVTFSGLDGQEVFIRALEVIVVGCIVTARKTPHR